jgi:hypothetical protein
VLGALFLALQVAAMALGVDASANFENAWVNLDKRPFWLVGLVLFIPGFFRRIAGAVRQCGQAVRAGTAARRSAEG